jgi:hypothetical protein
LTTDDVVLAFETAKKVQPSGKLADLVFSVIHDILDPNHLSNNGPLGPALTRIKWHRARRARFTKSVDQFRSDLETRKHAERLPDRRAFWEFVRILFNKKPRSLLDFLRFAQGKILLFTGLRRNEVAMLPVDWKRFRDFYDVQGRSAGEFGGYSRSLMLRHFAEKQRNMNAERMALFESAQDVPALFEEALTSTLDRVVASTAPLRKTLRRQVETGRILASFKESDLVLAVELYIYLTGNPLILEGFQIQPYVDRYHSDFDPSIFDELWRAQIAQLGHGRLNPSVYMYFNRFHGAPFRANDGCIWTGPKRWDSIYLRVGEVETFIANDLETKLSDTTPIALSNGELAPWEFLFLMPKRSLTDGRNEGLCDVSRYFAVGRMDAGMITGWLCLSRASNVFSTYGQTDEDKNLGLNPHSLRHLQNTELFRLGLADTIISKRYNRRSLAESYEYDHRSLAEELNHIELPLEVEMGLGEKASTVARMIKGEKGKGPIVEAFLKIQRAEGEHAAFEYLRAEADGFHSTPYGYCVNSFTVNPCPTHLECFNGCRHLLATNLPENRHNLVQLETRFRVAVQTIEARKSSSIGRDNQLQHARSRLAAVQKILATPAGEQVFPEGQDLSRPKTCRSVLDEQ